MYESAVTPELLSSVEIAFVDVRSAAAYAAGHISVAVPLAVDDIELRVRQLLPNQRVRTVVVDEDGTDAGGAQEILVSLGYEHVEILSGGMSGWVAAGRALLTSPSALSRALGEVVEIRRRTPKLTPADLHELLANHDPPVVLDTRTVDEYHALRIPGSISAPGASVLSVAHALASTPGLAVVVTCGGRTRGIIGAQTLIDSGFPNPVYWLDDGLHGWQFEGFDTDSGVVPPLLSQTHENLVPVGEQFRQSQQIRVLGTDEWTATLTAQQTRTVYLIDVRERDAYRRGHIPGTRSIPGGELVQSTELYLAVQGATTVLIDDGDLVRASVAASWLARMGHDVAVHAAPASEFTATGPEPVEPQASAFGAAALSVDELTNLRRRGEVVVFDIARAPGYFEPRSWIPGALAADLPSARAHVAADRGTTPIVVTSRTGRRAAHVVAQLSVLAPDRHIRALLGGTNAWREQGRELEHGSSPEPLAPGTSWPLQPTLDHMRVFFRDYHRWGQEIEALLEVDGLTTTERTTFSEGQP